MAREDIRQENGMTLIELIIVVAIIGILTAISVVMYRGISSRGYIADAKQALMTICQEEENYKAEHGSYPPSGSHPDYLHFFGGNGTPASGSSTVSVGEYNVAFTVDTLVAFTARATPKANGKMVYDPNNKYTGWLDINQNGQKNSQSIANDWP